MFEVIYKQKGIYVDRILFYYQLRHRFFIIVRGDSILKSVITHTDYEYSDISFKYY